MQAVQHISVTLGNFLTLDSSFLPRPVSTLLRSSQVFSSSASSLTSSCPSSSSSSDSDPGHGCCRRTSFLFLLVTGASESSLLTVASLKSSSLYLCAWLALECEKAGRVLFTGRLFSDSVCSPSGWWRFDARARFDCWFGRIVNGLAGSDSNPSLRGDDVLGIRITGSSVKELAWRDLGVFTAPANSSGTGASTGADSLIRPSGFVVFGGLTCVGDFSCLEILQRAVYSAAYASFVSSA